MENIDDNNDSNNPQSKEQSKFIFTETIKASGSENCDTNLLANRAAKPQQCVKETFDETSTSFIDYETKNTPSLEFSTEQHVVDQRLNLLLQKLNSVESQMSQMNQYFTKDAISSTEMNVDMNHNDFTGDQVALFEEMILDCKSIEHLKVNLPEFQFNMNATSTAIDINCDLCKKKMNPMYQ